AEDGIRDFHVTGVQTCALPISPALPGEPQDAPARVTLREVLGDHPCCRGIERAAHEGRDVAEEYAPDPHRERILGLHATPLRGRSEERRVGKEGRSGWGP